MTTKCTLCDLSVGQKGIVDGLQIFCCYGCQAVYSILHTKNQLEGALESPLFQQAVQAGLISNPELLERMAQKKDVQNTQWERWHLEIGDMWCPSCAEVIRLVLLQEQGIRHCVIDYATDLAVIEFSPLHLSKETVAAKIRGLGYSTADLNEGKPVNRPLLLRFGIAAFCSLNIMMFSYPLYATYFWEGGGFGPLFAWLSLLFAVPVATYCAWPIYRRFWNSFRVGLFGMEALVVLGMLAACGLSMHELINGGTRVYFDSMSVIAVFMLLGKMIESKAKFSAKEMLLRLSRSVPKRGRKRWMDGTIQFVLVKEIALGDVLLAYAGERIVLDGIVIEGEGSCDESVMTGESTPIGKREGSKVLSGSILKNGNVAYKVVASADQSALQKIIEIVEGGLAYKAPYVRAADVIVRWFVPVIVCVAVLAGMFAWLAGVGHEEAWLRVVSVLLISCPCALGIAAPLAEAHLMSGLARSGAIVRNRGCLQVLGKETLYVFDKTGTVTEGKFRVLSGLDEVKNVELLKGLAEKSIHPVACAIAEAIEVKGKGFDKIEEVAGQGMRGFVDGREWRLGSAAFVGKSCKNDKTTVYFARDGHLLGEIVLGDQVREEIPDLIGDLRETLLLSGDRNEVVACVAKKCGFKTWKGECSPLEKRHIIEELRREGKIVCMVGDGINDAPALTAAHVGISVVNASDLSIQVSDVLLTTDKLDVLPELHRLTRKGRAIIGQNLFWAFFYNGIGVALACFGLLSPLFAAFAMVASSLMVVLNAQRVR